MRSNDTIDAATRSDHPTWAGLLGERPAHDGLPGVVAGAVCAFADVRTEVRHLLDGGPALVPLVRRGALRVTGDDRIDFVQGQVSHDVRGLATGGVREALLLDHRGRPQADLVVVRREGDVYLAVDDGRGDAVRDSLEAHVVFDQVAIQTLDERLASFVVSGATGLASLRETLEVDRLPTASDAVLQVPWRGADVMLHARPRGLRDAVDVHVLSEHLAPLWSSLVASGAVPVGERALATARVAAGIAAAAAEGVDALPQESGLESRVSYRKGCYLGQEIMARVEARGNVRRSLATLALERAPALDDVGLVGDDGRSVGRVGTVAPWPAEGWTALAVLRVELDVGATVRSERVSARVVGRSDRR
jgi:tRNA-modifying protein YgfZ